jgi:hypothetical protein
MKNSGEDGNQAALCLQHETFGIPDDKEALLTRTPEQATHHLVKNNNVIGLSEDLRLKRLTAENQRLKILVEDLTSDKFSQARRITELNEETSRLKKALADLVVGNGNEKGAPSNPEF